MITERERQFFLVDVSDIFYFFLFGEGEGVRGARGWLTIFFRGQNVHQVVFLLRAVNSNYMQIQNCAARRINMSITQRQICGNVDRKALITDTDSPFNSK